MSGILPVSMNIEDRTLDENDHYTSSMTMKEFSDYFNSQDMTVMEFVETKAFFDYSVSNSMTSFHLVNELKKRVKGHKPRRK